MFGAILVLLAIPLLDPSKLRGMAFKPVIKLTFWAFIANFLVLMVLGAKHVETPFIEIGQICTFLYFAWFILFVPGANTFESVVASIVSKRSDTSAGNVNKPL